MIGARLVYMTFLSVTKSKDKASLTKSVLSKYGHHFTLNLKLSKNVNKKKKMWFNDCASFLTEYFLDNILENKKFRILKRVFS